MKAFFSFRLKQAMRHLQSIGIGYLILLVILTLGITTSILAQVQQILPSQALTASFVMSGTWHFARKDRKFLSKMGAPWKYVLIDYFLLFIPISILILILNGGISTLLIFSGMLLAFIPSRMNHEKLTFGRIQFLVEKIPSTLFEWKTVFRAGGFFTVLIYLIMVGVSWSIPGFCLSIFFIIIIIPATFEFFEPKEFIRQANGFIRRKIANHSVFVQLMLLPLYCLFLSTHLDNWYFIPVAILFVECILSICIITKYKRYSPSRQRAYLANIVGVYILLMLLPGFIIALIPLIFIHGRQAQKNISYYYAGN